MVLTFLESTLACMYMSKRIPHVITQPKGSIVTPIFAVSQLAP